MSEIDSIREKLSSKLVLGERRAYGRVCTFYSIINENTKNQLIFKNENIAIFDDIRPAATHHLLVVPLIHLDSILSLNSSHVDLLQEMEQQGIKLLQERIGEIEFKDLLLGFHKPPFNSKPHLHLHVVYPQARMKNYQLNRVKNRGWTPITDLITRLKQSP